MKLNKVKVTQSENNLHTEMFFTFCQTFTGVSFSAVFYAGV